jgi:hypothetical protein
MMDLFPPRSPSDRRILDLLLEALLHSGLQAWEQAAPDQAYAYLAQAAELAEPLGYL